MNRVSETVVSGEMYDEMQRAGVGAGYEPVPEGMQSQAARNLGSNRIADMDRPFKKALTKNQRKARRRALARA